MSTASFWDRVASNRGLAVETAKRYAGGLGHNRLEDVIDDAIDGLIAAARTFDPERAAWSTWAVTCMRSKILDGLKRRRRLRDVRSGDALPEMARRDRCDLVWVDSVALVMRTLRRSDRELLCRRYLEGEPVVTIAAGFGCSKQRIYQRLSDALQRARETAMRLGIEIEDYA